MFPCLLVNASSAVLEDNDGDFGSSMMFSPKHSEGLNILLFKITQKIIHFVFSVGVCLSVAMANAQRRKCSLEEIVIHWEILNYKLSDV